MKYPSFLSVLFAVTPCADAAITATEVGNNAPGSDSANEYVVILNSSTLPIDLTGYDIADTNKSWDAIGSFTLGANQSLVISSGADQAALETAWGATVPSGALFTVVNGMAAFNNSGTEDIFLRDASDTEVFSFAFDATLGDDAPPLAVALVGTEGVSVTPFFTVVPEPTVAVLGGVGLLGLLRRRRELKG